MPTLRSLSLVVFAALSFASTADARPANVARKKDTQHVTIVKNPADGLSYAIPKESPLRVRKLDGGGAHFSGTVRISGKYVYGYNDAYVSDAGETGEPDLYFVPDARGRRLLPYWYEHGEVTGFHFANANTFLAAALSTTTIAKVKARKIKSVTGQLTIWIDAYTAAEGCEAAIYTARFLRIEMPQIAAVRNTYADPISCG